MALLTLNKRGRGPPHTAASRWGSQASFPIGSRPQRPIRQAGPLACKLKKLGESTHDIAAVNRVRTISRQWTHLRLRDHWQLRSIAAELRAIRTNCLELLAPSSYCLLCGDDNAISRPRSIRELNFGGTARSVSSQLNGFDRRRSMQIDVLSVSGHPCRLQYISLIAGISSCIPTCVRVPAMSTARDGETTRTTVLTYRTLQKRLNVALLHTNNAGFVRILGECIAHLDLWRKDHIDPRGQLRAKSNSQAPRFLQTLDEASELMLHCEYKLGIRQEHLYGRAPVDE
jgi:hypothetical protein